MTSACVTQTNYPIAHRRITAITHGMATSLQIIGLRAKLMQVVARSQKKKTWDVGSTGNGVCFNVEN